MCTVSILLWTLWFTSSGDWWGCSSSPEEWHDHEVPGTQTGPGSQALLPHWQAKTEQVLTGLCTLHTHTHSQYLLSLSFVVVLDFFIAHSLVIQGQAPDHCFFTCVVCLPVYWDISLTRTFACSKFKRFIDYLISEHCSNQKASHLSCFLGFEFLSSSESADEL